MYTAEKTPQARPQDSGPSQRIKKRSGGESHRVQKAREGESTRGGIIPLPLGGIWGTSSPPKIFFAFLCAFLCAFLSEPIFYGDLVYKFKRIVGKPNFSDQFKKIVKRYIRVGYNLDVMRQSACLVLNPITVYSYGFPF